MNQNTSNLIIKQIKMTDEAVYTCSAFELINSQAKRLEIRVRVQSKCGFCKKIFSFLITKCGNNWHMLQLAFWLISY